MAINFRLSGGTKEIAREVKLVANPLYLSIIPRGKEDQLKTMLRTAVEDVILSVAGLDNSNITVENTGKESKYGCGGKTYEYEHDELTTYQKDILGQRKFGSNVQCSVSEDKSVRQKTLYANITDDSNNKNQHGALDRNPAEYTNSESQSLALNYIKRKSGSRFAATFAEQTDRTPSTSGENYTTTYNADETVSDASSKNMSSSRSSIGPFTVNTILFRYLEEKCTRDMSKLRSKYGVEVLYKHHNERRGNVYIVCNDTQATNRQRCTDEELKEAGETFISLYQNNFQRLFTSNPILCNGIDYKIITKAKSIILNDFPLVMVEESIDDEVTFVGEEGEVKEAIKLFVETTGLQRKSQKMKQIINSNYSYRHENQSNLHNLTSQRNRQSNQIGNKGVRMTRGKDGLVQNIFIGRSAQNTVDDGFQNTAANISLIGRSTYIPDTEDNWFDKASPSFKMTAQKKSGLKSNRGRLGMKSRQYEFMQCEADYVKVENDLDNSEDEEKKCPICLEDFAESKKPIKCLDKCKHRFCEECWDSVMKHKPVCPICGVIYGTIKGNQPHGNMNFSHSRYPSLPGYEGCGTITINYNFPSGKQESNHPEPGARYSGTSRTAYLPNNAEGNKVLFLLKRAFDTRLTFTIGTSVTTGARNTVMWNDIQHKTSTHGGPQCFGYPDPNYLQRVTEELSAKGINFYEASSNLNKNQHSYALHGRQGMRCHEYGSDGSKTEDMKCPICLEDFAESKKPLKCLDKCKHKFCEECWVNAMKHKPVCPICGVAYGTIKGNQPRGSMDVSYSQYPSLPGYERCGTIHINYSFPSGTQEGNHPEPGARYTGTSRTAYLPNNVEGTKVLSLLTKAFEARLTFTIGTSVTTGARNIVIWNDIHHKTSTHGGSQAFGYPDPTYLKRVTEELAAKGIK